jgi:hypothetical protein
MKLGLGLSLVNERVRGGPLVVNPNFDDLSGLTLISSEWYGGVPFGWNSQKTDDNTYSVKSTNGVFYANLGQLSRTNPFETFYQDLGTLQSNDTATLNLKACALGEGQGELGIGFYNSTSGALIANGGAVITASESAPQTVSLSGSGVAGTPIRLAFWYVGTPVGIRDISVVLT